MLPEIREVFAALQAYVAAVRQGGMVKVPPMACPRSAPAPPQGAPELWLARRSHGRRGETGALGAKPQPRVLQLVVSEAAGSPPLALPQARQGGHPLISGLANLCHPRTSSVSSTELSVCPPVVVDV